MAEGYSNTDEVSSLERMLEEAIAAERAMHGDNEPQSSTEEDEDDTKRIYHPNESEPNYKRNNEGY